MAVPKKRKKWLPHILQ